MALEVDEQYNLLLPQSYINLDTIMIIMCGSVKVTLVTKCYGAH